MRICLYAILDSFSTRISLGRYTKPRCARSTDHKRQELLLGKVISFCGVAQTITVFNEEFGRIYKARTMSRTRHHTSFRSPLFWVLQNPKPNWPTTALRVTMTFARGSDKLRPRRITIRSEASGPA